MRIEARRGAYQPRTSPEPPFLSLKEAAEWLCISLSTLKRMVAKGELAALRVGARRKISASDLSAYIAKDILLPSEVEYDETMPT